VEFASDRDFVERQYADPDNLGARRRLYQACRTNQYPWQRWVFDKLALQPGARVLELGCGAGDLWVQNLHRLPPGLQVTLSDISGAMLAQAERSLADYAGGFEFRLIDAQSVPYPDETFDLVIANDMLHHVADLPAALTEISRVLQPAGRVYAAASGAGHMKELTTLLTRFEPALAGWRLLPAQAFSLESGFDLLSEHFSRVALYRYSDTLLVTDAGMLMDYILSGRVQIETARLPALAELILQTFRERGGQLRIAMDTGLFEASGKLAE
jgi:SAM-dependent methyltransferase